MHTQLTVIVLAMTLVANLGFAADSMQTSQKFKRKLTQTLTADYLLHLPPGYQPKGQQKWPLLIFLHGAGERGTNLQKVAAHGPPKLVRKNPEFPFILVSPQCPEDEIWSNDTVLALLDHVIAKHKVDTNRIYLTGLSMGGYGSWSLAVQHPERFAAVAPICGGGEPVRVMLADKTRLAALRKLGIWAFHGAKDSIVPLMESERMVSALKKVGVKDLELTVYPEADHDSWTETYQNPKLYEWLLRHERKPTQP